MGNFNLYDTHRRRENSKWEFIQYLINNLILFIGIISFKV